MENSEQKSSAWIAWVHELEHSAERKRKRFEQDDDARQGISSLAAAIERWKGDEEISKRFAVAEIFADWEKIVGKSLSLHVQAVDFQFGSLTVKVPDASWRHQLFFMKEEIKAKVNHYVGSSVVKEIVFTG